MQDKITTNDLHYCVPVSCFCVGANASHILALLVLGVIGLVYLCRAGIHWRKVDPPVGGAHISRSDLVEQVLAHKR